LEHFSFFSWGTFNFDNWFLVRRAWMMHGLDHLRFLFVENWLIPQDNGYWMPVCSGRVVNCKVAGDAGVFTKVP